jgi:hypothetical protein
MEDVGSDELQFVVGRCAPCDRDVLTYLAVAADDRPERRLCVHCDQPVEHQIRAATEDELPSHGYGLLETQGCGNPNCGGGQCSRSQNDP